MVMALVAGGGDGDVFFRDGGGAVSLCVGVSRWCGVRPLWTLALVVVVANYLCHGGFPVLISANVVRLFCFLCAIYWPGAFLYRHRMSQLSAKGNVDSDEMRGFDSRVWRRSPHDFLFWVPPDVSSSFSSSQYSPLVWCNIIQSHDGSWLSKWLTSTRKK